MTGVVIDSVQGEYHIIDMTQTRLETPPSVKRLPPEHWHALWLEELFESIVPGLLKSMRTELKARNYSFRTIKNYCAAVNQYLI